MSVGSPPTVRPDWDAVEVGELIPAQEFTVRRDDLVRYAGASGDFNVIHWSERVAREVGLPDVIAHGMLTMALAARVVTAWAGAGSVVDYGVRFTRPVVVPDDGVGATLVVTGTIAEKTEGRRARIDITATSAGAKVLGQARAVVQLA